MRILYVVSLFPCWSETFIVREIHGLIAQGAEVSILSLKHPSETLVQADARELLDRVVYPAPVLQTLLRTLAVLCRHPLREARLLARLVAGLAGHPLALAKTLLVWWRVKGVAPRLATLKPAHIHAHWATYPASAALSLSAELALPFSFTAHAHDIFVEDHLLALKTAQAVMVVTISEFNRRFIEAMVGQSLGEKIRVVHCGIRSSDAAPESDGAGEPTRDGARILAVGRLDEIKGFPTLIAACALLRERGTAFQCDIIGSGPLHAILMRQITDLGLGDSVRLLGAMAQPEVQTYLERAAVFALPSVVTARGDRDGIPVALMEAMASGTPVVSTTVSGIPELVEHGVTGLLAQAGDPLSLADSITRLLDDPALGQRLARAARLRVAEDFTSDTEAAKLYRAINSLPCHAA